MTYANDPKLLARLCRGLAEALEAALAPSESRAERHLIDEAVAAALELDPPNPPERSSRLILL